MKLKDNLNPIRTFIRDITALSARDLIVYTKYCLLIWAGVAKVVLKRGPGFARELVRYPWIWQLLKVTGMMRRLIRGRSGAYLESICMTIHSVVVMLAENLEDVFYRKDRLIILKEIIPSDVLVAMGLKVWLLESMGALVSFIVSDHALKYIDEAENAGVNPDACSMPKTALGMALKDVLPEGIAMVSSNLPCDAGMASYTFFQKKYGVPIYRLDAPYNFYDERADKHFAEDLKEMIQWLEEHTPGRMDWKRLKEICEARNRMMELELELWDLIRLRPAPLAAEAVLLSHIWHFLYCGDQRGCKVSIRHYEKLLALARKNVKAGVPATKNERYRAVIWNPPFPHHFDILSEAERKWGIVVVNDGMTYNHHKPIDTSTPDSMLRGLSAITMQGPMVRHTRGPAENYLDDIFRMIKQFDLDMVWVSNHVGCKSTQAMNSILREKCRERKIPLLVLDHDHLDPRIVSHDGMMDQVDIFMKNVMNASRLDQ
jgi:benzoyl-CoA reductase/2-hydroxyglutaryl-CoA dehydratase subunit BcrC/BadD/HgdB